METTILLKSVGLNCAYGSICKELLMLIFMPNDER